MKRETGRTRQAVAEPHLLDRQVPLQKVDLIPERHLALASAPQRRAQQIAECGEHVFRRIRVVGNERRHGVKCVEQKTRVQLRLESWMKMSPSFNLDRANTATIIVDPALTAMWDWYAGLSKRHVPVEYWYIPDMTHDVFQVPQRIKMNDVVVDWFDFWLCGHEDGDPAKTEQYNRWRQLRQLHEGNRSAP